MSDLLNSLRRIGNILEGATIKPIVNSDQVKDLFKAAVGACEKLSTDNVGQAVERVTVFLKEELFSEGAAKSSEPKAARLKTDLLEMSTLAEAKLALLRGPINLPGGGTLACADSTLSITGPVDFAELAKFFQGENNFFNLKSPGEAALFSQQAEGLTLSLKPRASFGSDYAACLNLFGADGMPLIQDAYLTLLAVQFVPEFANQYNQNGSVAVRLKDGVIVSLDKAGKVSFSQEFSYQTDVCAIAKGNPEVNIEFNAEANPSADADASAEAKKN